MQIHCSTHLVLLNVTATQFTRSLNGIYSPHWLVQWSHHCLHMRIPVHSPQLLDIAGYIDVAQTILIILIVAGLFPDRPCIYIHIHTTSHHLCVARAQRLWEYSWEFPGDVGKPQGNHLQLWTQRGILHSRYQWQAKQCTLHLHYEQRHHRNIWECCPPKKGLPGP